MPPHVTVSPLKVHLMVHRADEDLTLASAVIHVPPGEWGARQLLYRFSGYALDTLSCSMGYAPDGLAVHLDYLSPGSSYEIIIEDYRAWDTHYTALFNPTRRTVYGPLRVPRRYRRGGVDLLLPVLSSTP